MCHPKGLHCLYRKVPRIRSPPPPPPPPPKKIVSRLNERIFVIMNAAACRSLKSCWSTIPFLKCGNRYAEALTITKIRSFKHEPFFFGGGGGGGELIRGTLRYYLSVPFLVTRSFERPNGKTLYPPGGSRQHSGQWTSLRHMELGTRCRILHNVGVVFITHAKMSGGDRDSDDSEVDAVQSKNAHIY